MRRNTDVELPRVRISIHILCEAYARATTSDHRSQLLTEIEQQILHAADLIAWDMFENEHSKLAAEHAVSAADIQSPARHIRRQVAA